MDRLSLKAQERDVLGKKVKKLRKSGQLPGHVFGKGLEGENVLVSASEFIKAFHLVGGSGLIDLKIGAEKVRPVLVREVQYDPMSGAPIHIDFFQVNLKETVKVSVPIVLIGEQPESVHLGEAIVLQTLNEIEVEALPTDLVENIEVDIASLKAIDDAITVGQLNYDKSKLTISVPEEEIVVKLAPAVTAEMEQLLEEQAAETAEAAEQQAAEEGAEGGEAKEGEEGAEGEEGTEGSEAGEGEKAPEEGGSEPKEGEEKS